MDKPFPERIVSSCRSSLMASDLELNNFILVSISCSYYKKHFGVPDGCFKFGSAVTGTEA